MKMQEIKPGQAFRVIGALTPENKADETVFVAAQDAKYLNTVTWAICQDGFDTGQDVKLVGDINELLNGTGMASTMIRSYLKK